MTVFEIIALIIGIISLPLFFIGILRVFNKDVEDLQKKRNKAHH